MNSPLRFPTMSDSTWDKRAAAQAESHVSAIAELLMQMDQETASNLAREFASSLIALLADIGAMSPNPSVASSALEKILDFQVELEDLKRNLLEFGPRG